MKHLRWKVIIISFLMLTAAQAFAWHDHTHLTVCKAAGFDRWYHCAGPDIAKLKAGDVESFNHWFNNKAGVEMTPQMVLDQAKRYNHANVLFDAEGHLPGAIIGSLRAYEKDKQAGKYAVYNLVYCAHYIGDLTMPLHLTAYDDFNKAHHSANDGTVENTILNEPGKIVRHMYPIKLSDKDFEADLVREVARIANISSKLGYKLRGENRDMTRQEAYIQLGHSASLLRAVLQHYSRIKPLPKKAF